MSPVPDPSIKVTVDVDGQELSDALGEWGAALSRLHDAAYGAAQPVDDPGLLSPLELEALKLTGTLAGMLHSVIFAVPSAGLGEQVPDHGVQVADWAEVAGQIHALQHIIYRQAAARAYPHLVRLLGHNWDPVLAHQRSVSDQPPT